MNELLLVIHVSRNERLQARNFEFGNDRLELYFGESFVAAFLNKNCSRSFVFAIFQQKSRSLLDERECEVVNVDVSVSVKILGKINLRHN